MGELTTKKQNLPKKAAIGQYVHDMLDLEIRALSLRKTAEETRKKAEWEENQVKSSLVQAEVENERAFNFLKKMKTEEFPTTKHGLGLGVFGGICLFAAICLAIPGIITGALVWGGVSFIFITSSICVGIKGRKEDQTAYVHKHIKAEKYHEESKLKLLEVQKKMEQNQIYVQKLRAHADELEKDIAEIEKSLQHNYALNVIPPDYRRLECLLWIDYAFRNDQVDTMREATLQCDKQLFRRKVGDSLQILAETVRSIGELLETMNTNISMMNQDLFRIAEAQEKQLSETQSARYAMESVEQGVDRLAFYEEMKRHGTF